jgi:hypothetical protein
VLSMHLARILASNRKRIALPVDHSARQYRISCSATNDTFRQQSCCGPGPAENS